MLSVNVPKTLSPALLLAGFALTPSFSHAEVLKAELGAVAGLGQDSVQTIVGPLKVVKKSGEDFVFDVVLNGKRIVQINEYNSVFIVGAYPSKDAASHVLLAEVTGGNRCYGLYRFVEIKRDSSAVVTDEFGTCFLLDHIVHKGDSWKFVIPEPGKKVPAVWEYRNGSAHQAWQTLKERKNPICLRQGHEVCTVSVISCSPLLTGVFRRPAPSIHQWSFSRYPCGTQNPVRSETSTKRNGFARSLNLGLQWRVKWGGFRDCGRWK